MFDFPFLPSPSSEFFPGYALVFFNSCFPFHISLEKFLPFDFRFQKLNSLTTISGASPCSFFFLFPFPFLKKPGKISPKNLEFNFFYQNRENIKISLRWHLQKNHPISCQIPSPTKSHLSPNLVSFPVFTRFFTKFFHLLDFSKTPLLWPHIQFFFRQPDIQKIQAQSLS